MPKFKIGDWVVFFDSDIVKPYQVEQEPELASVYSNARPVSSREAYMVSLKCYPSTSLFDFQLRLATNQDFLNYFEKLRTEMRAIDALVLSAQSEYHEFLNKKHNLDNND